MENRITISFIAYAGPELAVIGLGQTEDKSDKFVKPEAKTVNKDLHNAEDLLLSNQEEEYINSLIMTEEEARHKTLLWHNINADYLKEQKSKFLLSVGI